LFKDEFSILEKAYPEKIQTLMRFAKTEILRRLIIEQYMELQIIKTVPDKTGKMLD
jgi:hypothetical protein